MKVNIPEYLIPTLKDGIMKRLNELNAEANEIQAVLDEIDAAYPKEVVEPVKQHTPVIVLPEGKRLKKNPKHHYIGLTATEYNKQWKWADKVLFVMKNESKFLSASDIAVLISIYEPDIKPTANVYFCMSALKKEGVVVANGQYPAAYEIDKAHTSNEFANFPNVAKRF